MSVTRPTLIAFLAGAAAAAVVVAPEEDDDDELSLLLEPQPAAAMSSPERPIAARVRRVERARTSRFSLYGNGMGLPRDSAADPAARRTYRSPRWSGGLTTTRWPA